MLYVCDLVIIESINEDNIVEMSPICIVVLQIKEDAKKRNIATMEVSSSYCIRIYLVFEIRI